MLQNIAVFKKKQIGIVFLILSIIGFFYWFSGNVFDIYQFAFVGVVFEILWLPMLAMLFILPVLGFVFWVKEKCKVRSLYFYSTLICITTILLIIFKR